MSTTRMLAARLRVVAVALAVTLLGSGLALVPAPTAGAINLPYVMPVFTLTTKTGVLVNGLTVWAYPVTDGQIDPTEQVREGTHTAPGQYSIPFVTLGQDYAIYLATGGQTHGQFVGGVTSVEDAPLYSWASNGFHFESATVASSSSITGKVTGNGGAGLRGATVYAYEYTGSSWRYVRYATTGSTGAYSLSGLAPGSYRLEFEAATGANYLTEFSGNSADFSTSTPILVGIGAVATSHASMAPGAAISGTAQVRFGSSGPFPTGSVRAHVYRLVGNPLGGAPEIDWNAPVSYSTISSSTSGKWTVGGLRSGYYVIKLYDARIDTSLDERWISSSSTGSTNLAEAAVFAVVAGRSYTARPTALLQTNASPDPVIKIHVRNGSSAFVNGSSVLVFSDENPDLAYSSDAQFGENRVVVMYGGGFGRLWMTDDARMEQGTYTVIVKHPDYETFTGTFSVSGYSEQVWNVTLQPRSSLAFVSPPHVTGPDLVVGSELTLNAQTTFDDGVAPDTDMTYWYQWLRNGRLIVGATDDVYVTQAADVGKLLTVQVRAEESLLTFFLDRDSALTDVALAGVIEPGPAPTSVTTPWISSPTTPKPGVTLTANSGVWSTTGLKFDYQWYSDGAPIAGATSRTFTLTALEATHDITVELVATKPGHPASDVVVSSPVPVETLAAPTQTKLSVVTKSTTGLPAGQVRYTVTPGTWNVPGLTFSYLWSVDGAGVGVFANSYVVDTATQGASVIQVKVYAEKQGYADTNQTVMVQKGAAPTGTLDVTDETTSSPVDALSQTELGHVLRATPAITYPTAGGGTVTTTYAWQRSTTGTGGWTTITGAKQPTYTPGLADLNRFLRVLTTTSSTLYLPVVQTASAGKAVPRTDLSAGIPPTVGITGSTSVGTTHRATVTGAWPIVGVTLSYRWLTCAADCAAPGSFTAVAKATTSSWLPPAALAGREAVVEVTASKPGYAPLTVRSAAIVLDPLTAVTAFTPPTITGGLVVGDGAVGRPLTVKPGTFDVTVTRSYQWQYCDSSLGACVVDDDFITVGTNSTSYMPTAIGVIRVRETAARTGLTSVVQFSAPIDVQLGTLIAKVNPTWAPSAGAFIVKPGVTTPAATTVSYQWYLDGEPVGTNDPSFSNAETVKGLHVVVTLTRDGYSPRTVTLVPRKGTAPTATGTITGSAYGDTFVAPNDFTYPATATPAPVTTYQWYSNGTAIPRATAATFTPSTAYLGKTITVRVTSTSPFYLPRTHTTTGVVVQKADAPTGSPTIVSSTGAIKPGAKLSVALDPGSWSTTGLTFSYLWQSSPNGVTWANLSTASTYTLLTSQPGLQVRVLVTARKTGFTDAVVPLDAGTVDWLGPIVNASEPTLGGPLLSGAASPVGSTLTANPGLWNVPGLTFGYEWIRDGIIVPGATAATLTPTAEYYGDQLQVRVTAKAPGYQPVTALSNVVIVGQAAAPTATTVPKITRSGNVLSATPGLWNVDGLVFSFQWLLEGSPIVGATSSTHTIAATGIYSVVVTATRDGYVPGSRTIAMTAAISPI